MAVVAISPCTKEDVIGWSVGSDGPRRPTRRFRRMPTDGTTASTDADGWNDGFDGCRRMEIHPSSCRQRSDVGLCARARAQTARVENWKAQKRAFPFLPFFHPSIVPHRAHSCPHRAQSGQGHATPGTSPTVGRTAWTDADGWNSSVVIPSVIRQLEPQRITLAREVSRARPCPLWARGGGHDADGWTDGLGEWRSWKHGAEQAGKFAARSMYPTVCGVSAHCNYCVFSQDRRIRFHFRAKEKFGQQKLFDIEGGVSYK